MLNIVMPFVREDFSSFQMSLECLIKATSKTNVTLTFLFVSSQEIQARDIENNLQDVTWNCANTLDSNTLAGEQILFITPSTLLTESALIEMTDSLSQEKVFCATTISNREIPLFPGYNIFNFSEFIQANSTKESVVSSTINTDCTMFRKDLFIENFKNPLGKDTFYEDLTGIFEKNIKDQYKSVVNLAGYFFRYDIDPSEKQGVQIPSEINDFKSRLYKAASMEFEESKLSGSFKEINLSLKNLVRKIKGKPSKKIFQNKPPMVNDQYIQGLPKEKGLAVSYVMETLLLRGGVISVIQLVNQLILKGNTAYIATFSEMVEIPESKVLTMPLRYKNKNEMINSLPKSNVVVATFWTTAYWVYEYIQRHKDVVPVYFVQDFESLFYTKKKRIQEVLDSYKLIPNKIVKSDWLSNLISQEGFSSEKINIGLNINQFYQRKTEKKAILAMTRPQTPRRGFDTLTKVLEKISTQFPHVEMHFYGSSQEELDKYEIPFQYVNHGIVRDTNQLSEIYSKALVFIDTSDFQGLGRPGLEAMACGTATVLTNSGGINEYAKHNENCLMAKSGDVDDFYQAVVKLIQDDTLRNEFSQKGILTAQKFSHINEAKKHIAYFKKLVSNKT